MFQQKYHRAANAVLRLAALASIICLFPVMASGAAANSAKLLHQLSGSFEALASRLSPAVVEIQVSGYGPEGKSPDAPIGRESSLGSGVIVAPDGYIVTNYHVIAGEQRIKVVITPPVEKEPQALAALRLNPRIVPASVVGFSKQIDLAVLKIDASGLPTIPFAQYAQLRQGQLVLAIGSPEGLQNSVSLGLVSSVLRQDSPENPMVYIQTDAAINPGNSGGALVDVDGNLVGINTSILTQSGGNEGIGFAIPSGIVQFAYRQIRQYGYVRYGDIGATVQAITPLLASALALPETSVRGVIVSDVIPGGPADHAGLRIHDRIQSIDGAPVASVPVFAMNIYLRKNGDSVRLGVLRDDRKLLITVPVENVKPGPDSIADVADPGTGLVRQLGIVGVDWTPDIAYLLPPARIDSGVVVAATTTGYRAEDIGLQQGDVIHALNTHPVKTLADLRSTLKTLNPGGAAALQVERDGRLRFLPFEIE
jgi:serine protease Do